MKVVCFDVLALDDDTLESISFRMPVQYAQNYYWEINGGSIFKADRLWQLCLLCYLPSTFFSLWQQTLEPFLFSRKCQNMIYHTFYEQIPQKPMLVYFLVNPVFLRKTHMLLLIFLPNIENYYWSLFLFLAACNWNRNRSKVHQLMPPGAPAEIYISIFQY